MGTINVQVAAGNDDAHEYGDGTSFNATLDFLRATASSGGSGFRQNLGVRFAGITIPQGSTITVAYMEVRCYDGNWDDPNVDIYCNDVDDANNFTVEADVTSRAVTAHSALWSATGIGTAYVQSADFAPAVEDVVGRALWSSGNALCVLMKGSPEGPGSFIIWAQEKGVDFSAKLHIEYTENGNGNGRIPRPPAVSGTPSAHF